MLVLGESRAGVGQSQALHADVMEYPRSAFDINVYSTGDEVYSYYFATSNFTGLFKQNAGEANAVTIVDENDNAISFSPLTVYGLNSVGKPVENVSATRDGSRVLFESAYGQGIDLQFDATYNGVKETLTLQERPNSTSDLVFWSKLDFDHRAYTIESSGDEIDQNSTVNGAIDVVTTGWPRERDSTIVSRPEFGIVTARLWSSLRAESMKAMGNAA